MSKNGKKNACGNPGCSVSMGIRVPALFGRGVLDRLGYWSTPCAPCARAFEKLHPEAVPCWPFEEKKNEQAA
jgi:hypothetical protein